MEKWGINKDLPNIIKDSKVARAMNVCKRTGLAKRGYQPGMSATRLNNAWKCWGFQANLL